MPLILRHKNILTHGDMVHFTRAHLTPARPNPLHSHDFYELLWVQNGTVRHHLQDKTQIMEEGALVLVPPGQFHGVQAKGTFCLVVSITVHPDVIEALLDRHRATLGDMTNLRKAKLDSRHLADLNHAALRLEQSDRKILATEAFLLPVLMQLDGQQTKSDMPLWLSKAMQQANSPHVFKDGSAGLVALTGKAHAHVSRTMRRFTGQSPSEFVNDIRMTFAGRQLVTDTESVQFIAAECGIPNMAHFHKLFRTKYGMTPLKYRQKYQRDIVQPTV